MTQIEKVSMFRTLPTELQIESTYLARVKRIQHKERDIGVNKLKYLATRSRIQLSYLNSKDQKLNTKYTATFRLLGGIVNDTLSFTRS